MAVAIVLLHVVGFGLLWAGSGGNHVLSGGATFGVATGLLAYTLGLRHAFDADHISAIDNVTRKLVADGRRPLSVGFWFSLGHSTVVLALAVLLAFGVDALGAAVTDQDSLLHTVTGLIGPIVSTAFLLLIALANVALLRAALRRRRTLRTAPEADGAAAPDGPLLGGPLAYVFGPLIRRVDAAWKMYPLGFFFGLGFDTATEVALLVLAGGGVAAGLPVPAILALPIIFAAGMCTCDTVNGLFMRATYDRATSDRRLKSSYDVVVTGLSVAVALSIGLIQAISIAGEQLDLTGGIFAWAEGLDMTIVGYAIVALFVVVWALMLLRLRRGVPGPPRAGHAR